RDLAEILIATGQRPEAIALLEKLPEDPPRRADVIVLLAQAYLDEQRYDDVLAFLDATPHFVAWEGQMTTWTNFSRAHLERGRARLAHGEAEAALRDFSAAVSYPANLGVGRPSRPEHAAALYGRGQALAQLGRTEEARRAWTAGAAGAPGSGEQNRHIELCRAALAGE
ncbi:MAG: tetratricopeptide repeat protein, partial [Planctomycetota bacterium]